MKKSLLILLIVIILAVAGIVAYLILKPQSEVPNKTTEQTTETQDATTNEVESFYRYKASDVVGVFRDAQLPISDVKNQEIGGTAAPATEVESQLFVIASVSPDGGQILIFDNEKGLNSKKVWFERFPNLAELLHYL